MHGKLESDNMVAICKRSFKIGNSKNYISFVENRYYEYHIEIAKLTKNTIYYVNGQPMLERTFKENFDDRGQIRNDKIKKLLDG